MRSFFSPVPRRRAGWWAAELVAIASVVWIGAGCSCKEKPAPNPVATASAGAPSASAAQAGAPVPSAARKSWFAGAWTGTYRAAAHHIDLPTNRGGIPEWKADDGKAFVGAGSLELTCAEDGTVTGSSKGALGEQDIRGEFDEASVHARLVPKSTVPPVFTGTFAVSRAGTEVTGELQASTADGRIARTAVVSLTRRPE
jgi:hypothetical protein